MPPTLTSPTVGCVSPNVPPLDFFKKGDLNPNAVIFTPTLINGINATISHTLGNRMLNPLVKPYIYKGTKFPNNFLHSPIPTSIIPSSTTSTTSKGSHHTIEIEGMYELIITPDIHDITTQIYQLLVTLKLRGHP